MTTFTESTFAETMAGARTLGQDATEEKESYGKYIRVVGYGIATFILLLWGIGYLVEHVGSAKWEWPWEQQSYVGVPGQSLAASEPCRLGMEILHHPGDACHVRTADRLICWHGENPYGHAFKVLYKTKKGTVQRYAGVFPRDAVLFQFIALETNAKVFYRFVQTLESC